MGKIHLNIIITCSFFLLVFQRNSYALQGIPSNNITVIFKKNPLANSAQNGQFYTKNFIQYYDDNFIEIKKELRNKLTNDTLRINTEGDFYPIALFHNYIYFNYFLKTGDTVVFDFKNDIPNMSVLNRGVSQWEKNFPVDFKKRFNLPLKGSNMIGPSPKNIPSAEVRFDRMFIEFNTQNNFIDSLVENQMIDVQLADYYKNENKANLYGNILFKDISPYLYGKIPKDTIIAFTNNNKLLRTPFFRYFLEWRYIPSDILSIQRVNLVQSRTLDYTMAYDKINNHFTDPVVKEYLLFYCVNKIKEESTRANYNAYLAKFNLVNKNLAYKDILSSDEINNNILMSNDAIALIDFNGKQADLSKIIKAAKGKVVYIDLWASWCAPCRAAMPASKELKASYANKPVLFVYLSIDVKKTDWVKAAGEENLQGEKNSFLLLNPKNSAFTKKLNLTTIPRYLIYNKNGVLVNANAPGPDSPKLKDLLNQFLSN